MGNDLDPFTRSAQRAVRSPAGRRCRVATALGAGVLVLAACAGGASGSADSPADSEGSEVSEVVAAAPSLEFLGDLAVLHAPPMTVSFDAVGGSMALPDGASVEVPTGAFDVATEVTAVVADLDFERFDGSTRFGRAYAVSTVDDVALSVPLVLKVPVASDGLWVTQLIDGEWRAVEVPAGSTTDVTIQHFSEVPTVVVERPDPSRPLPPPIVEGDLPGQFLTVCLFTLAGGELDNDEYGTALAFSICSTALVRKFSPDGSSVSVACVGDRIDADTDFLAAISSCASDSESDGGVVDDAGSAGEADTVTTTTPSASEGPPPDSGPVDIGPLAWDADLTLNSEHITQSGDAWISLTRTAGTDQFSATIRVASTSITDFFEIGECTTIIEKTFNGTGSFDVEFPTRLLLTGDQFVDWQYPDCGGITENDNTFSYDLPIQITATGIAGGFEGWQFEAPGKPVPVGG